MSTDLIHTWPIRVYWEDTDAGGIVYYANYLKFFERARTEWLRTLGVNQQALREQVGGMFVVQEAQVRFLQSARLDDALLLSTSITERGRASMRLLQQCWLPGANQPRLLCEATIRVGWVNSASQKPGRIPQAILDTLT